MTPETASAARALSRISEIRLGFVNSQALHSAYELGVFEALVDGPLPLEALAEQINLAPVPCRRLLMVLVGIEVLAFDGERFSNTETGHYCTTAASVNVGATTQLGSFFEMSRFLSDALRENAPRWSQALGKSAEDAFASLYADPVELRRFAELMDAYSITQGRVIAECYDFSDHHCLMDIAGGAGGQSLEICARYPHLRGIVTDLAPVCAITAERVEARGMSDRFTAIPADLMAGPYPGGADVILLGHILHDWSDASCLTILRNCSAALPQDGVLLISESVLAPDHSGTGSANLKDIIMLLANESDARERTEQEYRELLDATGFEIVELIRIDAPRDLLVARKR